tara:strand:+ start:2171 stop:2689 length:519 start_codon:yes stop_codon:yes gene_type:complete
MKYLDIEEKAYSLLKKNSEHLKNDFEVDVYKIASNLSIVIHEKSLSNEISGLLIIKDGKVVIGVDSDQGIQRKRFTIAHELGHYYLHRQFKSTFVDEVFARSGSSNQVEREANAFAAALLMPKELIIKAIKVNNWQTIDDDEILSLAKKFNVSGVSMTYRLVNLNIIDQPDF